MDILKKDYRNSEKELFDLICQRTGVAVEKISFQTDFEHDLNLSREELMDFIVNLEEKYNISFSEENLEKIQTVGELKEILLDRLDLIS